MPAVWTVHVWAGDLRRALHGICGVDRDDMFVHVIVHMVEMAVMANRSVPAVRAMLVRACGRRFAIKNLRHADEHLDPS